MSIFSKTTGIDFQKFGEIFNETTFKNKFEEGRFYITVEEKESNKLYKTHTLKPCTQESLEKNT